MITFAGVGVFGGLFSLYAFSLSTAGGAEFFGRPLVGLSVAMIVLYSPSLRRRTRSLARCTSGHDPRRTRGLAGASAGWYLGAVIVLMTAYYASLPTIVEPLFGWSSDFATVRDIILFAMVSGARNLLSIGLLGRLARYGLVIELSIVTLVLLIVFVIGRHHFGNLTDTSTVTTNAAGKSSVQHVSSFGSWLPLLLGGGIFQAFWVLYTFENAGTLGEETRNASRNAPRAVLGAFGFVIVCGFLFLICLTTSLPDLHASMISGTPAQDAITNHLPNWVDKVFLFVVAEGLVLATSTMFTGATRHIYGMARDRQIPFSGVLSMTLRDGSPWVATIALGGLSIIPVFIFTTNTASIVGGATAAMYLAYFAVMAITLVARLRGWTRRGTFSLGRWGVRRNVLAALGAGGSLVDLMWPRGGHQPQLQPDHRPRLEQHLQPHRDGVVHRRRAGDHRGRLSTPSSVGGSTRPDRVRTSGLRGRRRGQRPRGRARRWPPSGHRSRGDRRRASWAPSLSLILVIPAQPKDPRACPKWTRTPASSWPDIWNPSIPGRDRSGQAVAALTRAIGRSGAVSGDEPARARPRRAAADQPHNARLALQELERNGVVNRRPGARGRSSASASSIVTDDCPEDCRRRCAATAFEPSARVLRAAIVSADGKQADALGLPPGDPVYEVVRVRLSDGEPISLECSRFPAERFPGLLEGPLGESLYQFLHEHFGAGPVRAVERLEAVLASAERRAGARRVPGGAAAGG